jgi:predicted nucleic acid-binding Zn ribbon protein
LRQRLQAQRGKELWSGTIADREDEQAKENGFEQRRDDKGPELATSKVQAVALMANPRLRRRASNVPIAIARETGKSPARSLRRGLSIACGAHDKNGARGHVFVQMPMAEVYQGRPLHAYPD